MSNKHKKVCSTLNYIGHFLNLESTVNGGFSIFNFFSLVGILIRITSSANKLKTSAVTAGIKKYNSITEKE